MQLKKSFLCFAALASMLIICSTDVQAQRKTKKRPASGNGYGTSNNGYGTPKPAAADTTKKPAAQSGNGYGAPAGNGYGNQSSTGSFANAGTTNNGIDTTLPIEVIKSASGGLLDSVRPSLRNDAAFERNLVKERTPLDYENIREDDAVYRVRVWREIDTREKLNLPFRYAAVEDGASQRFISILIKAIKDGDVTAFSGEDDRFTTPITPEEAEGAFGGGADTVASRDLDGNITGYQVRPKAVDPDSIYTFRIKEEWLFDKESSRMVVRILGIAPVVPYKTSTGDVLPNSQHPTWWVYYPDLRPTLAKNEAYNPKNYSGRMTWEELFENRMFSSRITKSTLDNPGDMAFKQYIKDPLFQLYEGESVKEKIFNYEQALWSY